MRISDWSSDVCSSDLMADRAECGRQPVDRIEGARQQGERRDDEIGDRGGMVELLRPDRGQHPEERQEQRPEEAEPQDRPRTEERRVGEDCGSTYRSRGSQYN